MISGTVIGPSLAARGHVLPAAQWSSIDASANNYKFFVFFFVNNIKMHLTKKN